MADLNTMYESLLAIGAHSIADLVVEPVIRSVQSFGFHLAVLDIRQNSRFHDLAVSQLLTAAGIADAGFPDWDEAKRLEFLCRELESPRPFTRPDSELAPKPPRCSAAIGWLLMRSSSIGADGISGV